MKTYRHTLQIAASPDTVWQALTNAQDIEEWGAGPAVMNDQARTKFKLWDGDIHGTNLNVDPKKLLVQEWYGGEWPHPSTVTVTLSPHQGGTRLELLHEGIPDEAHRDIVNGWKEYYLGPLAEYAEEQ